MKHTKRILSFVLVLVMVFALCVPALADRSYEAYRYYMCVGDSIASGCGLTKDGSETNFDLAADDYTAVYNENYIYYGYDFTAVPTAYHSIVAKALDAKLLQCARSGMRAVELRYFLEGVYNEYDESRWWDNSVFDVDGNGFTLDDLDSINAQVNYPEMVKKTNVLSINVGSNDVFSVALGCMGILTDDSESETIKNIKAYLNNGGNMGVALGKLIEYYQTMGKMTEFAASLTETFAKSYKQFTENYSAVLKKVYELNPDITVVAVGVFNPFAHFSLKSDSNFDLGALAAPLVRQVNNYLKLQTYKYDNLYYADVVGTETYDMSYDEPNFWQLYAIKVHPTLAGHRYMAEQILSVLPERGTLPFTDVPADAWYYDELYYAWYNGMINGTSSTEITPAATTTRAQAVTVLYRMAGSPNVSGLNEPFTDVPDDYWARDAIIWAYENAIISGYTATAFGPNDGLTRGQFVTIMHRYAGKPAASGDLGVFSDSSEIAGSYRNAVRWATANDVVNGYNDGTFRPNAVITRAQLAAILARFDKM